MYSPADLQLVLLEPTNVSASIVVEELVEYAAMHGDVRVAMALLKVGAASNSRSKRGMTALIRANL